MKKSKILIVTPGVLPVPSVKGGAIEKLVDYIIDENENNYRCNLVVISCSNKKAEELSKTLKNTKVIYHFVNNPYSKVNGFLNHIMLKLFRKPYTDSYMKQVINSIEQEKPDLIIVENRIYYGLIIRDRTDKTTVLHLHNDFMNENTLNGLEAADAFNGIWGVSEFISKQVKKCGYDKTKTLYNGLDLSLYMGSLEENTNQSIKLPHGKKIIIYVGRLVPYKGVDVLISVFKKLKQREDYCLLIAGQYDKSYSKIKKYKRIIDNMINDEDDIIMAGQMNTYDLANMYRKCDIGVIPSLVEESFCLSALEMLASGLPVICTDSGALPEIVGDDCGIIIKRENLYENLMNAIESKEIEKIDRESCIKRAKKYPKEVFTSNFFKMAQECIEKKI